MRLAPAVANPASAVLALLVISGMTVPSPVDAGGDRVEQREIFRELPAGPELVIELTSADCIVEAGGDTLVSLQVVHSYAEDRYQVDVREGGGEIRLRERLLRGSARGSATWYLTVPVMTHLLFSSASGDLDSKGDYGGLEADSASGSIAIRDLAGRIDVDTASGEVQVRGAAGELSVTTASGDVEVEGFDGRLDLRTAAGDVELVDVSARIEAVTAAGNIEVSGLRPTGECSFNSTAGDVEVRLAAAPAFDLSLTSVSGTVELDLSGHGAAGTFVFSALRNAGRIESPLDFEREEIFVHAGQTYLRKTFSLGSPLPRIDLATASGRARLKQ